MPRDRLTVITGLSGSGKSSLAFDTIYAEGQRRYVESLSAYARQFLGQMEKPDVDQIDGLSPAISIDQKGASRNPRSTVGTVTEVYDHLRLLFARVGHPHCPNGHEIARMTVSQIVDRILAMPDGSRLLVLGPVIRDRKTEGDRVFEGARRQGFVRVRVDGEQFDLDAAPTLDKYKRHTVEIVVDRLVVRHADEDGTPFGAEHPNPDAARLADSVETAIRLGEGVVVIAPADPGAFEEQQFSERYSCPIDGTTIDELEPRSFSFNSPHGACPECTGLGRAQGVRPGAPHPGPKPERRGRRHGALADRAHGAVVAPQDHGGRVQGARLGHQDAHQGPAAGGGRVPALRPQGRGEGGRQVPPRPGHQLVRGQLRGRRHQPRAALSRDRLGVHQDRAREVHGRAAVSRVQGQSASSRRSWASPSTARTSRTSARAAVTDALAWAETILDRMSEREQTIARAVLKEIRARLGFLVDVGLDYLTIDRTSSTLSGGEAQRIRLATQIGSSLVGVLYILDEPTIGLHQKDNAKLIATLIRLRDLGNTLIVVEHDEETIRTADWVIDIGPAAGEHGGEVIASGTLEHLLATPASVTGAFLRGERSVPIPEQAAIRAPASRCGSRGSGRTTSRTSTSASRWAPSRP